MWCFTSSPPTTSTRTAARPNHYWSTDGYEPAILTAKPVAEIADAATRVTGIPVELVLVVIQNSPAHFAIEGGRVLPEPGEEAAWLAAK